MKTIIFALVLLSGNAWSGVIIGNGGGGADPSKLPLAGGTLTGLLQGTSVYMTGNATFTYVYGNGSGLTGVSGETNTYTSSKTFTSDVTMLSTQSIHIPAMTQLTGIKTLLSIGGDNGLAGYTGIGLYNAFVIGARGTSDAATYPARLALNDASNKVFWEYPPGGVQFSDGATNNIKALTISPNTTGGKVGIGTTNPLATLDVAGAIGNWNRTKAQIDASTPTALGQTVFCTDCSAPDVCVSTGTSLAMYRRIGTTSGCGSGN